MDLHAISYTSSAVHIPTRAELETLLTKSRARNHQEAVTGVLLYCDGTFHQYIEGPREGLDRVYAAILRDPLHHHIFEMLREPIETREFAHWSMGYRGVDLLSGMEDDLILTELLSDESARLTPGRLLLNAFWTKGLGARYQAALSGRRPLA